MALEDLNPAVRVEEILDGADIEPATRLEYFMKKAANEVPKPAGSSDAGKVMTVNEDGDGYELTTPSGGLPSYTSADVGKVLGIVESSAMTADLIPEQSVSLTYSGHDGESDTATLNDCDWSNYAIGGSVSVIIDDDTYTATIQSGSDTTLKHFSVGNNPTFHFSLNEDGNTYLWAAPHESGTVNYVVKAGTVANANSPAWKMDGMPYVIHLTMTGPGTFTADKTFNEVSAAAADGAICIFDLMGKLAFGMEGGGAITADFISIYNNVLSSINIVYDSHGILGTSSSYTLTPAT